jgi:hypothetical protein
MLIFNLAALNLRQIWRLIAAVNLKLFVRLTYLNNAGERLYSIKKV